jgi:tetratricopeptide (TPR) repeat protein
MAAHPPSNPAPSNDGSGIFRRSARKVTAKPLPPEQDELTTLRSSEIESDESMESLTLQETPPPSSSSVADIPSELLFPEIAAPTSGVFRNVDLNIPAASAWHDIDPGEAQPLGTDSAHGETEYLESVDLVEPESVDLLDHAVLPEIESPMQTPTQADFDSAALFGLDGNDADGPEKSSIFIQGGQPLPGAGSGWLDLEADLKSPPIDESGYLQPDKVQPKDGNEPVTQRFDSASQLFAELAHETPESSTIWEEQATGRIPAKDVSAAFAEASKTDEAASFELPGTGDIENSNLFGAQAQSHTMAEDDRDDDLFNVTGLSNENSGPASSIFKNDGSGEHTSLDFDNLQLSGGNDDSNIADLFDAQQHDGSSIFDSEASAEFRRLKEVDDAAAAASSGSFRPEIETIKGSGVSPYNSGLIDFGSASFGDLDNTEIRRVGTHADVDLPNSDEAYPGRSGDENMQDSIFDGQPALGAMMSAELTKAERESMEREEKAERNKTQKKSTAVTSKGATQRTPSSTKPTAKTRPSATLPSYGDDVADESKEKLAGGLGKFVGGTAFGVLAAGVAFAGLYLGGVIPNQRATDQAKIAPPVNGGKTDTSAPVKTLVSADPGETIKSLEQTPEADKNAKINATLGQARIQQQLAVIASGSKPDGDELAKAETELTAAVKQGSEANAPLEDQQSGVRAALHLGLIKETAGDMAGALGVYADAATKFPRAKRVFDTAVTRVKLMAKPDANRTSQLSPKEIESLLNAAVMTSVLIAKAEDKPAADDEEAGFLYWDAANAATAGKFDEAGKLIDKAKAAHDKRRLKLVGKNANPLSDPQEQIFLRSCDDLKELYTLKASLYASPNTVDIAKKDGSAKALEAALATGKKVEQLQTELKTVTANATTAGKKLTEAEAKAKEIATKLEASDKMLRVANDETLKVAQDGKQKIDDIMKDYLASKKVLEEKTTTLVTTETQLTKAKADAKTAATAIDTAWAELVKNKVVEENADRAKLPTIIKELALTSTSGDAKKAAEAMKALQVKLDDSTAMVKKLEAAKVEQSTMMANTIKSSDAKLAEANKKFDELKTTIGEQIKTAVAKAETGSKDKIETLARQLAEVEKSFALEKTALETKFAAQLREARSGATPVITVAETVALAQAGKHLADGITSFHSGNYATAEQHLNDSIKSNPAEARAWYFLGLAQYQQGRVDEAKKAFRTGADFESRNKPNARTVGDALERVQFSLRGILAEYRN